MSMTELLVIQLGRWREGLHRENVATGSHSRPQGSGERELSELRTGSQMCPLHTFVASVSPTFCLGVFMHLSSQVSTNTYFQVSSCRSRGGEPGRATAHESV